MPVKKDRLTLNLDEGQRERITEQALEDGFSSVGEWIRAVMMLACGQTPGLTRARRLSQRRERGPRLVKTEPPKEEESKPKPAPLPDWAHRHSCPDCGTSWRCVMTGCEREQMMNCPTGCS